MELLKYFASINNKITMHSNNLTTISPLKKHTGPSFYVRLKKMFLHQKLKDYHSH